jgi:FixJ family two-component response regulator
MPTHTLVSGGFWKIGACFNYETAKTRPTRAVASPLLALEEPLMGNPAVIVIVEDDESVRESVPGLLNELGYAAQAFVSAEEFLASDAITDARCLILDIGLPGMSGPELQRELIRRGLTIPTIFITGRADRSIPPGLLDAGAVACLFKPFSEQELRDALAIALKRN